MGRVNYAVELGFDIYDENGLLKASQIVGSAVPGGDAGPQDAAPISSIYHRNNGEFYVKTANAGAAADWDLVPVQLSSGYTPANGDPTVGDSFEEAIEKLDANQDDIQTASGLAQGDTSTGSFTGALLTDTTIKGNLQELETAVEAISGGAEIQVTGLTTLADVDTFLVDDCQQIEWEVVVFEEATPANKQAFKMMAMHDGTAGGDAVNVDDTQFGKLKLGSNFNLVMVVDLSGAAGSQTIRLRASSSTAGVTITVRRTIIA